MIFTDIYIHTHDGLSLLCALIPSPDPASFSPVRMCRAILLAVALFRGSIVVLPADFVMRRDEREGFCTFHQLPCHQAAMPCLMACKCGVHVCVCVCVCVLWLRGLPPGTREREAADTHVIMSEGESAALVHLSASSSSPPRFAASRGCLDASKASRGR